MWSVSEGEFLLYERIVNARQNHAKQGCMLLFSLCVGSNDMRRDETRIAEVRKSADVYVKNDGKIMHEIAHVCTRMIRQANPWQFKALVASNRSSQMNSSNCIRSIVSWSSEGKNKQY